MKKISIIFLACLFLLGCGKEPVEETKPKEEERPELIETIIVPKKNTEEISIIGVSYEDESLDIIYKENVEELNEIGYIKINTFCKNGPGEEYDFTFEVQINEEVQIKGIKDDWYLIEHKGMSGYILRGYVSKEKEKIEPNYLIKKTSNAEDYVINKINQELEQIPENLYNILKAEWKIYITNEDLNEKFFDGKLGYIPGATVWTQKEIYIINNYDKIEMTTLHEIGHAIDCELKINEKEEWINIYNEEKILADFMTNHCKSSVKEYFAESFSSYIKNPKILEEKCPKTNEYIKQLIKSY